jgi:hypothetical protein
MGGPTAPTAPNARSRPLHVAPAPTPAPQSSRPAPAPRGTERITAALTTALRQLRMDITVLEVTRGVPSGHAAVLGLGEDVFLEDLEPHTMLIADALRVPNVQLVPDGDATVRVEPLGREDDRARKRAVWVPQELKDAVDAAKHPEEPLTTFVLDAFNRQYDKLGTFFARRTQTAGPMPTAPRRVRHGIKSPTQLWMYLTPQQEVVLDKAERESGAGNRSALITRILEEDLQIVTTPRYSG